MGPTASPTKAPTAYPTAYPTASPTKAPTAYPTALPTKAPTAYPTAYPTASPTSSPTTGCSTSPCQNAGACVDGALGAYTCTCTDGYHGATCAVANVCSCPFGTPRTGPGCNAAGTTENCDGCVASEGCTVGIKCTMTEMEEGVKSCGFYS